MSFVLGDLLVGKFNKYLAATATATATKKKTNKKRQFETKAHHLRVLKSNLTSKIVPTGLIFIGSLQLLV